MKRFLAIFSLLIVGVLTMLFIPSREVGAYTIDYSYYNNSTYRFVITKNFGKQRSYNINGTTYYAYPCRYYYVFLYNGEESFYLPLTNFYTDTTTNLKYWFFDISSILNYVNSNSSILDFRIIGAYEPFNCDYFSDNIYDSSYLMTPDIIVYQFSGSMSYSDVYINNSLYCYEEIGSDISYFRWDIVSAPYHLSTALYTFEYDSNLYDLDDVIYYQFTNYINSNPFVSNALDSSVTSAFNDGYNSGYIVGNGSGYESGYRSGYLDGETDSYPVGYSVGLSDGYDNGYVIGYNAGLEVDNNWLGVGMLSIVDIPFMIFKNIFDFNVFGFNIYTFVLSLLTLGVVLWLLKKIFFNK